MAAGFKVWDSLGVEYFHQHPHVASALVVGSVITILNVGYKVSAPALKLGRASDEDLLPSKTLGWRNLLELPCQFVQGQARDVVGSKYLQHMPLFCFLFLWVVLNTLIGLLPGFASGTDNLNMTLAMGASVFIYYNVQGFRALGWKYLEHYTGHLHGVLLLLLGPLMFVIELISNSIRPVTLGMRLRSNMYAEHKVYGSIVEMMTGLKSALGAGWGWVGDILGGILSAVVPMPIVFLGLLITVVQALVFILLTMVYVGLATADEEHH